MGFTSGLLAGIATGAEEVISEDIRAGKLETQQLAKLRAERTIQRQDKRDETLRENIAKSQKLAAQLGSGGEAILKHYIEKGGLPYAEEATAQLLAYTRENDITPAAYAGISVGEGDLPTAQQLGEMATAPVKALAPAESSARGWAKMFGYGGPEAIQRKTDSYVSSMSSAPTEVSPYVEKRNLEKLNMAIPVVKTFQEMSGNLMKRQFALAKKLEDPSLSDTQRTSLKAQATGLKQELQLLGDFKKLSSGDRDSLGEAFDKETMENGMTPKAMELLKFIKLKETAESTSTGLSTGTYIKGSNLQTSLKYDIGNMYKRLGINQGKIVIPNDVYDPKTNRYVTKNKDELALMGKQEERDIYMKHVKMARKGGTDTLGTQLVDGYAKRIQELDKELEMIGGVAETEVDAGVGTVAGSVASAQKNSMPANKRQATDIYLTAIKSNPTQVAQFKKFIADGKFEQVIKSIQNSGRAKGFTYTRGDAMNIINIIETIATPGGGPTG